MTAIVIFGSSRERGKTWEAVQAIVQGRDVPVVSLNQKNISAFDYEQKNKDDDFIPLMEQILTHDIIILATPVYWYTMSAVMKTFIDRWSDLLTHAKDTGRKMRGKTLYVISSYSIHPEGKQGFETIFQQTCEYMGMNYGGCYFYYSGEDSKLVNDNGARALEFGKKIFQTPPCGGA